MELSPLLSPVGGGYKGREASRGGASKTGCPSGGGGEAISLTGDRVARYPVRWVRRPGRWRGVEALAVAIISVVFGATFAYPLLQRLGHPGITLDWDAALHHHWVAVETVTRFHQIPLWNPYACGGTPLLGEPQSRILTPFFLLHLVAGPVKALHLEVFLHLAVGAAGGYVLGRTLGLGRLGATAVALVFPSCSTQFLRLGVGHTNSLPYAYLPWIVACFSFAVERRRLVPGALAGLLLALVVGEGGVYVAPHAGLLLGMLAVAQALAARDVWPLVVLAETGAFGLAFAAPKLLPALEYVQRIPRLIPSNESTSLSVMATALFSRDPAPHLPPLNYWEYHEYGAYLGPAAALLALAGVVLSWRRAWPWTVTVIVFFGLALGDIGPASPWSLLHRLPLFASQHVPSRFLVMLVFSVGVLAGLGTDAFARIHWRWARPAVAFLILAGAVDAFLVGPRHLRRTFEWEYAPLPPAPRFKQVWLGQGRAMYASARANMGALDCFQHAMGSELTFARAANLEGYRGEAYVVGSGKVRGTLWTPNALEFQVALDQPGVLVVNQNFNTLWELVAGHGEVFPSDGLLAVRLPAGAQRLTLRYGGGLLTCGLALATFGGAGLAALWYRERSRPDAGWNR